VVILTRHQHHARQVLAALRNKKAVYCEKPLALNLAELDEIEAELSSADTPLLTVGYNRRFAPMAQQLAEPLAIPDIGLAARNIFDMPGVCQNYLHALLEHIEDRLPIDSGALQDHMGAPFGGQPIAAGYQFMGHRTETLDGGLWLLAGAAHHQTNRNSLLVDIDPTAALKNGVHASSFLKREGRSWFKNLTRVFPVGTTICDASDLPRSVLRSRSDHQ
jgi:hypothetical protein